MDEYEIPRLDDVRQVFEPFVFGWREPDKILQKATLVVAHRAGTLKSAQASIEKAKKEYNAVVIEIDYMGSETSSSLIRAYVALGKDIGEMVPPSVRDYILQHNLYGEYKELVERVRTTVPPDTFEHTVSTVVKAFEMNNTLRLPARKVFLAALLHDITKNHPFDHGVPPDAIGSKVAHQFSGAYIAGNEYGIADEDILDAICYHTTAKPGMSTLGKLIYLADALEPLRDYGGVEKLRESTENDFEQGFIDCLKFNYGYITGKYTSIYPLTEEAYKYYLKDEK